MRKKPNLFSLSPILVLLCSSLTHAKNEQTDTQPSQPPNIGNYALGASQQPGPLISFGQNIIDKGQLQFLLEPTYLKMTSQSFLATTPALLYGFSDTASLYISMPVALKYTNSTQNSSGASDTSFQLEYELHESSNAKYTTEATLVTTTSMPTGSIHKVPATGVGAPTFFIGTTYDVMFVNWSWFVSPGIYMPATYNGLKQGEQYLYQFGLNSVFASKENKYIFSGMLELNGTYVERNSLSGKTIPNTGGNTVEITPSLWYSTNNFIAQLGVTIPVVQQLNGTQVKSNYFLSANATWNLIS